MKNKTQQLRQEIRYIIKEELENFEQSSREVEYDTFSEVNEPQEGEIMIDGKLVDPHSVELGGLEPEDYPEFEDAYVIAASFEDGTYLDQDQISELMEYHDDFINDLAGITFSEGESLKRDMMKDDDVVLEIEDEDIENLEDYTDKLDTAVEKRKELKGNK